MDKDTQERKGAISIEVDGQTHSGTLIIRVTRELTFTVEYPGRTHTGSRARAQTRKPPSPAEILVEKVA